MDARRISTRMAGTFGGSVDTLDGTLRANLPRARHSKPWAKPWAKPRAPRTTRSAGPFLAHYHGQVWNAAELARSLNIGPRQANRYRDLLAGAFMVRIVPPWFESVGKRIVKSPKGYQRDSGIVHFLLGLEELVELRLHPRYGANWEGFALEQALPTHGQRQACFYATQRGAELDLLMRHGLRWGFEFKCTDAPHTTQCMHIVAEDPGLHHPWVLYPGDLAYALADNINALPVQQIGTISSAFRR